MTPEPRICPFCDKPIRFVPLEAHIDACPVRVYRIAGYDTPVVQAFSDMLQRRAAEPDAPQGERS